MTNRNEEELEAQLCCQCGAMEWAITSMRYVVSYWVRKDGHVEFKEDFDDVEYRCNKCGAWCLLGIAGTPKVFRELVRLDPMERILRTLECVLEDRLKQTDENVGPDDVLEWLEVYFEARWKMLHKGDGNTSIDIESFLSKAGGLIAKWKLLEEP